MALLGIFSKRDKNKTSGSSATGKSSVKSVTDSSSVTETSEYVLPDRGLPALPNIVYGNGQAEASSSKFHLGLRKRSTPASEAGDYNLRPPQVPISPSSRSEAHLDVLRPPPTRGDLFATYGDPKSAYSTRSLPDAQSSAQDGANAAGHTRNDAPSAPKKQGGLFSWAHRERKKSKVSDTPPSLSVDVSTESFNLKAFRHVRPESPSPETIIPGSLLVPPARPRPRGDSVASDSSQRISVAAFREMAARRSAAPSPTSSPILLRPPSRTDSLEHSHLRPSGSSFQRVPVPSRGSTLAQQNDSSSSESDDSGESESENSGGSSTMRPQRQRTITQKSSGRASTELGHRSRSQAPIPASSRSALGHGEDASDSGQSQRPPGGGFFRSRASQSTSAAQPNAAAKRASQLVSEQVSAPPPPRPKPVPVQASDRARSKSRARDSYSDSSSDSSSDDSDDAPLASLVRPPRPGSAASNATSGSRSRVPAKPLIDISQLGGTPPLPSLPRSEQASPASVIPVRRISPPVPEKDTPSSTESKTSFRPTHAEKPSLSDRLARIAQGAGGKSTEALATAAPIERRSLDARPVLTESVERGRVIQPARSQTAPMSQPDRTESPSPSPSPAPRPRANTKLPPSPNAAAAYDLTDPKPIVPTPIRERSPPPAFAVTSRPPSQLSLNTSNRLSGTQATIRMVSSGSGSTSSSPTAPTSVFGSSSPSATATSTVSSDSPVTTTRTAPFVSAATFKASLSAASSASPSPISRSSPGGRQRSSTLIPSGGKHISTAFTGGGLLASPAANSTVPKGSSNTSRTSQPSPAARAGRSRSSTLLPQMDITPPQRTSVAIEHKTGGANNRMPPSMSSPSFSTSSSSQAPPQSSSTHKFPQRTRQPFITSPSVSSSSSPSSVAPPSKPFAVSERGASPASSTGDSSSGRTPLTPADGSDLGLSDRRGAVVGAGAKRVNHRRGASVSFDEELPKDRGRSGTKAGDDDEQRRKERRRSEAKAAIELGKVVNGKITLPDDEEDMPLNSLAAPRMSMANPMLNFIPPSPMPWQGAPNPQMMNPSSFMPMMPPPNADPQFLAAHQHAMMVAKQAYQMAVAQQAMAAANDEWERGSSVSAFSGGMGMNMAPMGAMPSMMAGGYGMGWNNPMMFSSAQTMYAGSTAGSELGVGWGSRSEYGGPARNSRTSAMYSSRQSAYGAGQRSESQPMLSTPSNTRPPPRPRTKTSPTDGSLPAQHPRTRHAPPPSSWKYSD